MVKWKRGSSERENFKFITTPELNSSKNILIKLAQLESFPDEYNTLLTTTKVSTKSKIISLNPIMNNNLIKVEGRIRHANIPEQSKHQVILSKDHPLTEIIMRNIHEDNNHIGREHTLAVSRKTYWVPSCRGMIKRVLSNCINCKKERAMPRPTLMGDVPKERVDIGSKPFSNTGVDYFGPYYVKISK